MEGRVTNNMTNNMKDTPIFLATLGQRPEAITMALDVLIPRYRYTNIRILHTDTQHSDIAVAYTALMHELTTAYPSVVIGSEVFYFPDGSPLTDINDQHSAETYFEALLEILRYYRADYRPIHLLLSGGRKAMSIYGALAAATLFGENDRVWTILTPSQWMRSGLFHLPPGQQDRTQVVQLPISTSRFLPGMLAGQSTEQLRKRTSITPRQWFLNELSEEENRLTEILKQHPYASNTELALLLNKAPKTIENQFRGIYRKLFTHFDFDIKDKRKRQALLDVLVGRV